MQNWIEEILFFPDAKIRSITLVVVEKNASKVGNIMKQFYYFFVLTEKVGKYKLVLYKVWVLSTNIEHTTSLSHIC